MEYESDHIHNSLKAYHNLLGLL